MKIKWYKPLITILTLMFCMSVLYYPALATEIVTEIETQTEDIESYSEADAEEIIEFEADVVLNTETGEEIIVGPDGTPILAPMAQDGTGFRPFTYPGTGTVIDNAVDSDGKEFYTISSVDGDIFYLIIDRQRSSLNVYFLNAVTELDLLALAMKNERELPAGASYTTTASPPAVDDPSPPATIEPDTPLKQSGNTTMYIALGIAFLGAVGAAYYFKIVKGKRNVIDDDDDFDDLGEDDEDEYGYDEPDDGTENNEENGNGGERE